MDFKNIISTFGVQILSIVYGLISSIITARVLGTEGQGELAFIMLIVTILSNYIHLGTNDSIPYVSRDKNYNLSEIFYTNINYLLILSILMTVLFFITKSMLGIMDEYSYTIIVLIIVFTISNLFLAVIKNIYIIKETLYLYNKINFYGNTIRIILTIILMLFDLLSIETYMIAYITSVIIQVVYSLAIIDGISYKLKINKGIIFSEFQFGIILFFASLFIYLNYKVDQIMIKYMLDSEQLGIYSVGVNLAELAFLIPQSVVGVLMGKIANNKEDLFHHIIIKYTFYVTAIVSMVGILMAPLISFVYGDAYKESESVIVILFIGIIFASIGKVGAPLIVSKGKRYLHLIICGLTLIINIIMNLNMIPSMGIKGSALASTISYVIYGILYIIIISKVSDIKISNLFKINKFEILTIKNNIIKVKGT